MKNSLVIFSVIVALFGLTSCLTMSYNNDIRQTNTISGTELTYTTTTDYFEDIENPFYVIETSFPIEDDYKILKDDVMTLQIYFTSTHNMGQFEITYEGSSWRFMKGDMKYKIDEKIYNFIDESPYHDVLSGGSVKEKISNYPLVLRNDTEFLTDIRSCKSIIVQYYAEPYTFEQKEVLIVNDFFTKYFDMTYEEISQIHNNENSVK